MDVDTQRSDWWSGHEQLMAEIDGRRPHRSPTGFKVALGVTVAVVGVLLVAGALWPTYLDRDSSPLGSTLVGAALALVVVAGVVSLRQSTSRAPGLPARRVLYWDQRARALTLLATADPADQAQIWWAADLARRVAAESHLILVHSGLGLMTLSQALDPVEVTLGWVSLLTCAVSTTGAVVWAVQDSRARAFLRWHAGSPAVSPR